MANEPRIDSSLEDEEVIILCAKPAEENLTEFGNKVTACDYCGTEIVVSKKAREMKAEKKYYACVSCSLERTEPGTKAAGVLGLEELSASLPDELAKSLERLAEEFKQMPLSELNLDDRE